MSFFPQGNYAYMSALFNAMYSTDLDNKCYFRSYRHEYEFLNQTTATVEVEMWMLYPRRDIPYYRGSTTPFDPYSVFLTAIQNTTASGTAFDRPAVNIYQASEICSLFKIKNVGKRRIQAGTNFRHVVKMSKPAVIEGRVLPNYYMMRNFGRLFVVKLTGSIASDSSDPANKVTVAPAQLSMRHYVKYSGSQIVDAERRINVSGSFNALVGNPRIVADDLDASITVSNVT